MARTHFIFCLHSQTQKDGRDRSATYDIDGYNLYQLQSRKGFSHETLKGRKGMPRNTKPCKFLTQPPTSSSLPPQMQDAAVTEKPSSIARAAARRDETSSTPQLLQVPTTAASKVANFVGDISDRPLELRTAPHQQDWNKSTDGHSSWTEAGSAVPTITGVPIEKEIELSKLEDQTSVWAGYELDIIPDKKQARWFRNFRHQLFYVYRRLFSVVFLANFGVFLWVAIKGPSTTDLGKAVIANVTLAVMMRQDYVIDAFFVTFTAVPRSWPIAIRKLFALVYHIGGLHSGGGVSAMVWHILFCAKATQDFIRREHVSLIPAYRIPFS